MYCLFGLIGTLVMGILGREAWNDARAWRQLFSWSAVPAGASGPSGSNAWPRDSPNHCSSTSLACRNCPVHRG